MIFSQVDVQQAIYAIYSDPPNLVFSFIIDDIIVTA